MDSSGDTGADRTRAHGKTAKEAKTLELKGWHYPRHLRGRMFSIIRHGDAEGAESVRQSLHDWLCDMELIPAGAAAVIDRYVGYYEPYAMSHEALDRDEALMEETRAPRRFLCKRSRITAAAEFPAERTSKTRARNSHFRALEIIREAIFLRERLIGAV